MEKWLSISELSQETGIPESTVRRYTSTFKEFFRYDEKGRGKKYSPEAKDVLNRISSLYKDDLQAKEIREILSTDFAFTVETDKTTSKPPIKSIERQFEEFKQQQENFNRELLQQLEKQNNYINESINKRDQELMKTINEMLETKKLLLAAQDKNKKRWWERWRN